MPTNEEVVCSSKVEMAGKVIEKLETFTLRSGLVKEKVKLAIERLSGAIDEAIVVLPEEKQVSVGDWISFSGRIGTRNILGEDGKSHLDIYIEALNDSILILSQPENFNQVTLAGYICRPIQSRITPKGKPITDICLAVNRSKKVSYYIPCVAWTLVDEIMPYLEIGDWVRATGRFQSRVYDKKLPNGEVIPKTAYEVSLNRLESEVEVWQAGR